jgi:plastocyanin
MRKATAGLAPVIVFATLLASCGGGADESAAPHASSRARSTGFEGGAKVELDAAVPADTLRGVVRFAGDPPARRPLPMSQGSGCSNSAPLSEALIVTAGGIANVLVHARSGVLPESIAPAPTTPVVLNQEDCVYAPHVVALRAGQPLQVTNSDGVTHNVNAKPQRGERFNLSQTPGAPPIEAQFERGELSIPLTCDIHPWMSAFVHVLEHDAFALSAASGEFSIRGLAPGRYRFEAVHEALGAVEFEVELDGRAGARAALEFRRSSPSAH